MVAKKCSIRDYFRHRNKENVKHDPSSELHFIPSWDNEFLYLLGLEEVVHFRLELLDRIVYTVSKTSKTKGRKKMKKKNKTLTFSKAASTPPKDPLVCTQCSTDFSCSWKQNTSGSFLCQSCFKSSWKEEHWSTSGPEETSINSSSGNVSSPIPASSNQPVRNDPQGTPEGGPPAFNQSISASAKAQESDQLVPGMSACSLSPCSNLCPSSSSLSSPNFYSDSSSYVRSPSTSDLLSSPIYYSSPSSSSSFSDGSCSPYLLSSSDLYSSSSSLSSSPPCSSPSYLSKKARAPYWMDTPLAKGLVKDDRVKQEMKVKMKRCTWNKPPYSKDKTEKTASCGSPSAASSSSTLGSDRHVLQKAQVPDTGSVLASIALYPSVPNAGKRKSESQKLVPSLNEGSKVEDTSQELKSSKLSHCNFSSAVSGCSISSHSAKSGQCLPKPTIHHTSSTQSTARKTFSPSVEGRQQALRSKSGCLANSLINPTSSTHEGKMTQQYLVPQKVKPKESTIRKFLSKEHKMDKLKQETSIVTHLSTTNLPSSSASSGLPKKIPHNPK